MVSFPLGVQTPLPLALSQHEGEAIVACTFLYGFKTTSMDLACRFICKKTTLEMRQC